MPADLLLRATPLDTLLSELYASAAEPQRWTGTLDELCRQTGACSAVLQAFSFEGTHARLHWVAQDSRTRDRIDLRVEGVTDDTNPRLEPRRIRRGLNRVSSDEALFEPSDDALPRLQERLAMLGLGRFVGTLQEVRNGVYLGLALHRPVDDPQDFSPEQVNGLAALAPHLGQAFVLTDRLYEAAMRDQSLRLHLDGLRCGMALCDPQGIVHWMNASARQLLAGGDGLHLRGQRLCAQRPADTDALLRELAQAEQAHGGTVRYLRLGEGERGVHIAIRAADRPALLALVLTPSQQVGSIPRDALARMFGLTPTESRLLGALVTGTSVDDYARLRGVSVGTARVQLKQVLAKTGAHRQSDLVRLVLSSAAAHLVPHDPA